MKQNVMEERISRALYERSAECERGILSLRDDGRAGFLQVGPNLMLWSWIPLPGSPMNPFDLFLN